MFTSYGQGRGYIYSTVLYGLYCLRHQSVNTTEFLEIATTSPCSDGILVYRTAQSQLNSVCFLVWTTYTLYLKIFHITVTYFNLTYILFYVPVILVR
jgi:hypothetical protein